jgi:hypothetical protein
MLSYLGLNFHVNHSSEGTAILVNRDSTNFYSLLPIWLGFFSYRDVAPDFNLGLNFHVNHSSEGTAILVNRDSTNFLVPQGSLMSCDIISKYGKDSLMLLLRTI